MTEYIVQRRKPNGGWAECGRAVDRDAALNIIAWRLNDGYQVRWLVDGHHLPLPRRSMLDGR